ncbi:hypothetical protein [Mucilaginibacter kameinonensis]|uniref:hypothetical protein n=1 Tax=Mucilaginibacter kameinonensis TaxID=452286 RepID=UPI0013CE9D0D|nr:hypothetical protein [Mucilaginibacter kameinonensis]
MATKDPNSSYESQALKKAISDAYKGTYQIKGTTASKHGTNADYKKTITVKK